MNYFNVNYHWYYDLVFRVKYNFLIPKIYVINFLDYIKAGIAYNTRSYELATRKIDFFVEVLQDIENEILSDSVVTAIKYFYEDIFYLYKQYVIHVDEKEIKNNLAAFLPSFEDNGFLRNAMLLNVIDIQEYNADNEDNMLFEVGSKKVYLCSDIQKKFLLLSYNMLNKSDLWEVDYANM